MQPYLDYYVPRSLGVTALRIKRFSLGSVTTRSYAGSSNERHFKLA